MNTQNPELHAPMAVLSIEGGFVFLTCKDNDRLSIATTIERLINMLDDLDPDPDLEPSLGAPERHPGFGWGGIERIEDTWLNANSDDREAEDEREDGNDDEYSLGWHNEASQAVLRTGSAEAELGWTEHVDQTKAGLQEPMMVEDGEPDLGFVGNGTGWRLGDGTDDREDDPAEMGIVDFTEDDFFGLPFKPSPSSGGFPQEYLSLIEQTRREPGGDIVREIIDRRDAARQKKASGAKRVFIATAPSIAPQIRLAPSYDLKADDFDKLPWA